MNNSRMFRKTHCYRYRSAVMIFPIFINLNNKYTNLLKWNLKQSDPEPVIHFKNQNYDMLKMMYDENNLFEDPLFPAEDSSMFYSNPYPPYVEWKRPHVYINSFFWILHYFNFKIIF